MVGRKNDYLYKIFLLELHSSRRGWESPEGNVSEVHNLVYRKKLVRFTLELQIMYIR